jgi:hypothetical protein
MLCYGYISWIVLSQLQYKAYRLINIAIYLEIPLYNLKYKIVEIVTFQEMTLFVVVQNIKHKSKRRLEYKM